MDGSVEGKRVEAGGRQPADRIEELGIVGAGGAGFPTAVKLKTTVPCVIVNGAECEPLLHKDKELLLHYADEMFLILVRRGSHSAPLTMTQGTVVFSFTAVGNPARPVPTNPHFLESGRQATALPLLPVSLLRCHPFLDL